MINIDPYTGLDYWLMHCLCSDSSTDWMCVTNPGKLTVLPGLFLRCFNEQPGVATNADLQQNPTPFFSLFKKAKCLKCFQIHSMFILRGDAVRIALIVELIKTSFFFHAADRYVYYSLCWPEVNWAGLQDWESILTQGSTCRIIF